MTGDAVGGGGICTTGAGRAGAGSGARSGILIAIVSEWSAALAAGVGGIGKGIRSSCLIAGTFCVPPEEPGGPVSRSTSFGTATRMVRSMSGESFSAGAPG